VRAGIAQVFSLEFQGAAWYNSRDKGVRRVPDCLVKVENVSMRFNLARKKVESLKEYVVKALARELYFDEFWALSDISFTLGRGEILGVMGPNGAGKSTLMRIVAGIISPTSGTVEVNGSIALLQIGLGFDSELTGIENIYLGGAMLGHSRDFMRAREREILDFAELHEFADVPVKNYSSGMRGRLGFSIATMVRHDILVTDEGLATGDEYFVNKCNQRINQMIKDGTSVIIVSHNPGQVQQMCTHALLLDKGRMVQYGRVKK
jgi:ABC-2 type transport system ATP-binding protein/lipopolysaccharide transport system ATP-binding protein